MIGRRDAVSVALSVVVPTYNRLTALQRTLDGLAAQVEVDVPIEVVVVSDGSVDGTDDYLTAGRTPLPVVALCQPNAGPAAARNRGIDAAQGDLVLFLDDDVVPAPDAVSRHLRHHEGGTDELVVIGPMLTPADAVLSPWVRWEQAMLDKQYVAMVRGDWTATARQFYTGNASLKRRLLVDIGGFDASLRRAEDIELAYRLDDLGCVFVFDPTAIVWHYAERTFSSWLDVARSYGRNDVHFAREHGRGWVLEAVADEYWERSPLIRLVNRACQPRPRLRRATVGALVAGARLLDRVGLERLSSHALSSIYSLEYYGGIAEELGDPHRLFDLIDARSSAA